MGDTPVILLVLKVFLHFLGALTGLWAGPTLLIYAIVKGCINLKDTFKESNALHALLWFPRWLVVNFVVLLPFAQSAGLGYLLFYLVSRASGPAIVAAVVSGIGSFAAIVIGLFYSQMSWMKKISPKIEFTSDKGFFPVLGQAWFDFVAFFCLLFSIIGLVRIPAILMAVANPDELKTKESRRLRADLVFQVWMTLVYWFTIPFVLVLAFVPWRWPIFRRHWEKEFRNETSIEIINSGWIPREIIREAATGALDAFIFPMGFLLIFMFSFWRIPTAVRKIWMNSKIKKLGERRVELFAQIGLGLLDFLCGFASIPVYITLYRLPSALYGMYIAEGNTYNERSLGNRRRTALILQSLMVLGDLGVMFMSLLLWLTVYRIPHTYQKVKSKDWGFRYNQNQGHREIQGYSAQAEIAWQSLLVLVDLPFIAAGFIVTIFLWRAFFLYRDLYKATTARERRKLTLRHLGRMAIDILDTPCAFCGVIITFTVWRAPHMYRGLWKRKAKRNDMRLWVYGQFLLWLLDIPAAFATVIVFLSIYRTKILINNLRDYLHAQQLKEASNNPNPNPNPVPPVDEDNPAPKGSAAQAFSWHVVVGKQFGLLLLDAPFPVFMLLTLWRLPFLIRKLLKECETAQERRLLVLKTIVLVLKDIPCILGVLLIFITGWRIPSFIEMVKKIEEGDDQHVTFAKLFLQWMIDVPFVVLGFMVCVYPWRAIPMFYRLHQHCKTANDRRMLVACYGLLLIVDPIILALSVLISVTFWRIPTLIFATKYSYHDIKRGQDPTSSSLEDKLGGLFIHTASYGIAVAWTVGLFLHDLLTLFELVWIILTVLHVPSVVIRMWKVHQQFRSKNPLPAAAVGYVDGSTLRDDFTACEECFTNQEPKGAWATLSLFRPLIANEFLLGFKHLPHLFFLPFKVAGLLFAPVFLLLWARKACHARRSRRSALPSSDDPIVHDDDNPNPNPNPNPQPVVPVPHQEEESDLTDAVTVSFMGYPLEWLYDICRPRLNFWGMDQVFVVNIGLVFFYLTNELALIPAFLNGLFMFIVTFGSPLWKSKREMLGWYGLGGAPAGLLGGIESVMLGIQVVSLIIFAFSQGILLLLPITIAAPFYYAVPGNVLGVVPASFTASVRGFFSDISFWRNAVGGLPGFVWAIEGYWVLIMVTGWHITHKVRVKYIDMYDPLMTLLWLVQRVMAGLLWKAYRNLLAKPTAFCYKIRKMCCLGELLMFPIFLVWAYWSVALPFIFKNYFVFIATGIISIALTVMAYRIIKENWRQPVDKSLAAIPKMQATLLKVKIPSSGGLSIQVKGAKPSGFAFEDARLLLEGEQLWQTLTQVMGSKAISAAKVAVYPVQLTPNFLNAASVNRNATSFDMTINIGIQGQKPKIGNKTIMSNLDKILAVRDPEFEVIVEYGKKSFGWKNEGILLRIPNVKLSDFLESNKSGKNIISGNVDDISVDISSNLHDPSSALHHDTAIQISGPLSSPNSKNKNKNKNTDVMLLSNNSGPNNVSYSSPNVKQPSSSNSKNLSEDQKIQQIVELGFTQEQAFDALFQAKGDVNAACDYLLQKNSL